MGCAQGYMAASDGYPVYYCSPDNNSIGYYTLVSGDCIRRQFTTTFYVMLTQCVGALMCHVAAIDLLSMTTFCVKIDG